MQSTVISKSLVKCSHKTDLCTHRWTEVEDEYMLQNPELTYRQLSEVLGRTVNSIRHRWMRELKQSSRPRSPFTGSRKSWTLEEEQFIKDNAYGILTHKQIAEALDRSWQAVAQRVIKLGLVSNRHGGHWTSDGQKRFYIPPYGMEWPKIRLSVFERDGFMCQHSGCKLFIPSTTNLHAHHIIPRHLILDDRLTNLVTLCETHHYQQKVHQWESFTPDMIELLPDYQRVIYEGVLV